MNVPRPIEALAEYLNLHLPLIVPGSCPNKVGQWLEFTLQDFMVCRKLLTWARSGDASLGRSWQQGCAPKSYVGRVSGIVANLRLIFAKIVRSTRVCIRRFASI